MEDLRQSLDEFFQSQVPLESALVLPNADRAIHAHRLAPAGKLDPQGSASGPFQNSGRRSKEFGESLAATEAGRREQRVHQCSQRLSGPRNRAGRRALRRERLAGITFLSPRICLPAQVSLRGILISAVPALLRQRVGGSTDPLFEGAYASEMRNPSVTKEQLKQLARLQSTADGSPFARIVAPGVTGADLQEGRVTDPYGVGSKLAKHGIASKHGAMEQGRDKRPALEPSSIDYNREDFEGTSHQGGQPVTAKDGMHRPGAAGQLSLQAPRDDTLSATHFKMESIKFDHAGGSETEGFKAGDRPQELRRLPVKPAPALPQPIPPALEDRYTPSKPLPALPLPGFDAKAPGGAEGSRNLPKFLPASTTARDVAQSAVKKISDKHKGMSFAELRDIFDELDVNGDRSITHREFLKGLKKNARIAERLGKLTLVCRVRPSRCRLSMVCGQDFPRTFNEKKAAETATSWCSVRSTMTTARRSSEISKSRGGGGGGDLASCSE
jgi:hypothetical protein